MALIPIADDIALWRQRAVSARAAAEKMVDTRCRWAVQGIADSYERMAEMAEHRIARRSRRGISIRSGMAFVGLVGGGSGFAAAYLAVVGLG